jgi:hypothetical protein
MPAALKLSGEKSLKDFTHGILLFLSRQTEDIGVIVLTSPPGTEGIMA